MTCSDFLAGFSEFYDADPSLKNAEAFRAHLDACSSCRRYHEVVRRGAELLRDLPPAGSRADFHDRLRHSIYTHEEEQRRDRGSLGSSAMMAVVAIAAVLAVLIWTPSIWVGEPSVDLAPIVVHTPGPEAPAPFPVSRAGSASSATFLELELWTQSNTLLYERSPLYQRSREPGLVRTGLQ
jgi:anti-sigma factor RsiW